MEDEKHFILNCSQYDTLRGKYKIFLDVDNDIHSIRKLLNPTNSKSAREICSFLKEAFETNKFDSCQLDLFRYRYMILKVTYMIR